MTNSQLQRPRLTLLTILCTGLSCAACEGAKLQEPAPNLDILQVLPASATLQVGDTLLLGALRLKDGQSVNVTSMVSWSSDNEAVATVSYDRDSGAMAVAVGPGTAHIVVAGPGASASAEFVVISQVTSIELYPQLFELAKGTSRALSATLIAADGTKREPDERATWSTSDATIASVDAAGVVHGVEIGDAVISVIHAGLGASQPVHVRGWTLESITAAAIAGTTLPVGGESAVEVTGHFSGGHTQDVTSLFTLDTGEASKAMNADDAPVVTLDTATVTAGTTAGVASITGAGKPNSIVADRMFSLDFTVIDSPLTALALDLPATLSTQGEPGTLTLTGIYGDDLRFQTTAEFMTDPDGIVYIDSASGTIVALAPGVASVTASVKAGGGSDGGDSGAQPPSTIAVSKDIMVVDSAVSGLSVKLASDGDPLPLTIGGSVSLTASAAFGALDVEDVTDVALWSSDDETVAVVSNVFGGRVTGVGPGSATITATYKGWPATFATLVAATPR